MTVLSSEPGTPSSTGEQTDAATTVARLRAYFDTGATREPAWRDAQLAALLRLLDEQEEAFVAALAADLRRPAMEAVMLDLASTRGEARHARSQLRRWMRPQRVRTGPAAFPGRAWYQHDPLGVVLVIGAWNYPVHLVLGPLVAALAAGNCAVLKPSEMTPACSALLAEQVPRYLDDRAVAVVEGGPEATHALLDQALDHCFFTGSSAVGSAVMAAAAPHLTPVTLELGGKSPAVVTASADLAVTAKRIATGKLLNSGQTCVAPDYVLVDAAVREPFTDVLVRTLREFGEQADLPLVSARHAERLAGLLATSGGEIVLGGQVDVDAATAQPTVVLDPAPDSAIMTEEIFGPVLPVVTVDSLDDAITRIRRGGRPLASYLFSAEPADEERFLDRVSTGGVLVNNTVVHLGVSELPFGGVGASGMGSYHGRWGFETFSHPTAVLRQPTWPDLGFIYPPHGPLKRRLLRRLL